MSISSREPLAGMVVTEEDFMALPESMQRTELMEGEVYMAPSPTPLHQRLMGRIYQRLDYWAARNPPACAMPAPLDIRFGPSRILQPDVALFLEPVPETLPVQVIPALVLEVLSTNRAQDIITKRMIYMQAGVREYWMADRARSCFILSTSLDAPVKELDTFESQVATGLRFTWADVVPA